MESKRYYIALSLFFLFVCAFSVSGSYYLNFIEDSSKGIWYASYNIYSDNSGSSYAYSVDITDTDSTDNDLIPLAVYYDYNLICAHELINDTLGLKACLFNQVIPFSFLVPSDIDNEEKRTYDIAFGKITNARENVNFVVEQDDYETELNLIGLNNGIKLVTYLNLNSAWKHSFNNEAGWETIGFDDNLWNSDNSPFYFVPGSNSHKICSDGPYSQYDYCGGDDKGYDLAYCSAQCDNPPIATPIYDCGGSYCSSGSKPCDSSCSASGNGWRSSRGSHTGGWYCEVYAQVNCRWNQASVIWDLTETDIYV